MGEKSKAGTNAKAVPGKRTGTSGKRTNNKLAKRLLDSFRKSLMARRDQLTGDMSQMADEALGKSRLVSNGDVSAMPTHMADVATDAYEQEFTLELMANEREELKQINGALDRIERGVFGTCAECGARIRQVRLKALPHAQHCINCKRQMEQGKG